jgi:CheY-like chemotaxis protein
LGSYERRDDRQLPAAWRQRILIIEDDAAIAELLSVIFAREGIVERAKDAEEGLRKTSKQYFDVIISDFDMPVVSSIALYEQAAKKDSSIGKRFLLFKRCHKNATKKEIGHSFLVAYLPV